MNPALWGPGVWQCLFACAWHCVDVAALRELLLQQLPQLLPCEKCRNHFKTHRPVIARRAHGEPTTPAEAFYWLWALKDEVNKQRQEEAFTKVGLGAPVRRLRNVPHSVETRSLSFEDLTERYAFHGPIVDEVALGDALVLVALEAHSLKRDDVFLAHCATLSRLLPVSPDSQLRAALAAATRPIIPTALRAAKAARVERGLLVYPLSHYKTAAED